MARGTLSFFFILSFFGGHLVPAAGYANGKVTKACSTMEPHHGVPAQTTTSPYQLKTNVTSFSPGDRIQVILTGSKSFEGFLLQARDPTNQASVSTIGTFMLTNPIRTQLLTCSMHQDSAVSHTSDHKQSEVVVIWNAPHDAPDTVQFFLAQVNPPTEGFREKSKWKYVKPHLTGLTKPWSIVKDPTLKFKKAFPPQLMTFELSGPAEGYIAFALSLDKWMGNDDVYMCVTDGDSVSVSAAFVSGRTYPEGQTQVRILNTSIFISCYNVYYCCFFSTDFGKHSQQPLVSSQRKRINGSAEVLHGSRGPLILKMHGALMLFAWMLTGSVGTFIASFYKHQWANQTLLGQKVWFQVHRGLMMLTVILTAIAFSFPFFYRRGWSKVRYPATQTHSPLAPCSEYHILTLTSADLRSFSTLSIRD
uniref:Reelin domain-containing protein n=1 Tax=Cyprinodon variegatus TaxID=28743 RepID=A0A3Q2CCD8_CYPVA